VSETTDLTKETFLTDEARCERFYDWLSRASDNNSMMCAAITVSWLFLWFLKNSFTFSMKTFCPFLFINSVRAVCSLG